MKENEVTQIIIESSVDVHRTLGGPGLLESVYEEALTWELKNRGLMVLRQILLPITYKGHELASPLRIDLLVNRIVLVECKAAVQDIKLFQSQILTYLRLSGIKVGLLLNFGQKLMKDGIHRVVNNL